MSLITSWVRREKNKDNFNMVRLENGKVCAVYTLRYGLIHIPFKDKMIGKEKEVIKEVCKGDSVAKSILKGGNYVKFNLVIALGRPFASYLIKPSKCGY